MGKSSISMAMFNSYVKLPEGNQEEWLHIWSRNWMATEIFDHQAIWMRIS
jgi:hypothetical protein